MTIEDIHRLIANSEGRHLELKKTTGELKDAMHTACAFLNGEGGWLVFGITPTTLNILGQVVSDSTKREIAQALSGLEPAVDIQVQYIDVPDRQGSQVAIYFDTFVWGHVPYTYSGRPYYKVESTTRVMPREMFEERLRASKPKYYAWERQIADSITVGDLNEDLIRGALRIGFEKGRIHATALTEPLEKVLEKFELLTNGKLNNAAVVLFSTKITGYPQLRLRMARFRGTDKNEFIDNQRVSGNFFELLDAGSAFFLKHLNMSGKIVGFRREESLEIPSEALREALTNALCHCQFEKDNLTPSIAIYDDRIEIENPGILPPQITAETIKLPHNSYPYNPVMAEVLYRTTFLENWGTGAKRILDACKAHNVTEPIWSVNGGFVCVTFKRSSASTDNNPSGEVKNPSTTQVGLHSDSSTNQVRTKYEPSTNQVQANYEPSTSQVKKLIQSMSDEYMSIGTMMSSCQMKSRMRFRTTYVLPALEEGAIERKYPESPKHPKQQYCLTEKAKAWKYYDASSHIPPTE